MSLTGHYAAVGEKVRRGVACLLISGAALTGACTDDESDSDPHARERPPVLDRAERLTAEIAGIPGVGELAGPVFVQTAMEPFTSDWLAVLTLEHDPILVWDDLADLLRADGWTMDGSSIACQWQIDDEHGGGLGPPLKQDAPVRSDAVGVECRGRAASATDGLDAWLAWGARGVQLVLMGTSAKAPVGPAGGGVTDRAVGYEVPEPVGEVPKPTEGEPFGVRHDCFGDGRYSRFTVPEGATVIGPSYLGFAVLRVGEADASDIMSAFEDQIGGGASQETYETSDGPVRAIVYSAPEAGSCSVTAAPDGTHLVVLAQSA